VVGAEQGAGGSDVQCEEHSKKEGDHLSYSTVFKCLLALQYCLKCFLALQYCTALRSTRVAVMYNVKSTARNRDTT